MERYITQEQKSDLLKIGIYQIAGGTIGILLLIWMILKAADLNVGVILIVAMMASLFIFSIAAGTACIYLKGNATKLSLINQILQIVGFVFLGFGYQYAAGLYFSLGLDLTESLNFNFGFGISKVILNLNTDADKIEFHFNLVATGLSIWINQLHKRINEEIKVRKISELGIGDNISESE
ncbi:MAG: hypothetical protein K2Q24_17130 [Chitinophagaceae bacterium]|nr:hypothetical protein [Chitinophagaceae bacterium]